MYEGSYVSKDGPMQQRNGQCRARNAIWQVAQPTAKSDVNENINAMAMNMVMQ